MARDNLDFEDILRDMRPFLLTVYHRGYRAGGEAMKQAIQALVAEPQIEADAGVGAPALASTPVREEPVRQQEGEAPKRAPRGAAERALEKVFSSYDGLTLRDLERLLVQFEPLANPKTAYNIMLRDRGSYRQDGGRWFKKNKTEPGLGITPQELL